MSAHPLSNEEYYALFADSVSDILSRHAPDGTVLYISPACRSVLGCEPSDFIGRSLVEFAHPDDRRVVLDCVRLDLAQTTDRCSIIWRIRHHAGHYVWVETDWRVIYQPDGAVDKLLCLTRNITERMHAEIALRESEERFRLLADHAPVLIWLADRVDNLTFFNQSWLAFTGRTMAQEVGQGWLEDIHPDDRSAGLRVYEDAFAAREPYTTEYRLRRCDGQYRWVMETGTPRFDANGDFLGFIGSCVDIHQRKEFEDAIQHLNLDLSRQAAQLQLAYQEMEAFTYSVSHDLRAPLRAINGFSRILMEDYAHELSDEALHCLQRVSANALRMSDLIDNLLLLSWVGRKKLVRTQVDMAALAREAFDEVYSPAEYPRSVIEIRHLPPCSGDPALLKQVFVNLLANALKFSRHKPQPHIIVDGYQDMIDGVVYVVRDNGAGFDAAYADKLFGVFQRLHDETEFEGTGVGLAIVQRIIHRHHGRIRAESALDQGAAFYFTIGVDI